MCVSFSYSPVSSLLYLALCDISANTTAGLGSWLRLHQRQQHVKSSQAAEGIQLDGVKPTGGQGGAGEVMESSSQGWVKNAASQI